MSHQREIHYPIYVCSDWGTCKTPACGIVVEGETVRTLDLFLNQVNLPLPVQLNFLLNFV